jgi:hypothetical protein
MQSVLCQEPFDDIHFFSDCRFGGALQISKIPPSAQATFGKPKSVRRQKFPDAATSHDISAIAQPEL